MGTKRPGRGTTLKNRAAQQDDRHLLFVTALDTPFDNVPLGKANRPKTGHVLIWCKEIWEEAWEEQ